MAESVRDLEVKKDAEPEPWHPYVEGAKEKIEEFRKSIPVHTDGYMRCIEKGEHGNSFIGWGTSENGVVKVKAMYGSTWYHANRTFHLSLVNWDVFFMSKESFTEIVAGVLYEQDEWEKNGANREQEARAKKIQEDMEKKRVAAQVRELEEWRNKPLRKWWANLWEKRHDGLKAQMLGVM